MENEMVLILVWAIIMTITLGIFVVVLLNLKKKHDQDIRDKEYEIQNVNNQLEKKQKKSFQMGANVTSGDYTQILGDFALLSEYDQIITLSTTSKQPSLDLIGIKNESLDFVELKKKGAPITYQENKIKKLVEEKKVSYKVFDIDLPDNFTIEERKPKEKKAKETKQKEKKPKEFKTNKELRKIEAKKEHSMAYEPWSQDDDEFLKEFWNNNSNNQSKLEKIQSLSQKFDRSEGGILSRLQKLRLISKLEKMELSKK